MITDIAQVHTKHGNLTGKNSNSFFNNHFCSREFDGLGELSWKQQVLQLYFRCIKLEWAIEPSVHFSDGAFNITIIQPKKDLSESLLQRQPEFYGALKYQFLIDIQKYTDSHPWS